MRGSFFRRLIESTGFNMKKNPNTNVRGITGFYYKENISRIKSTNHRYSEILVDCRTVACIPFQGGDA